jgi:tripartite ATP-independent transporter DctM subunit
LLLTAGYMVICGVVARRRNYPAKPAASWRERARVTRTSIWALFMPVLIIGGIRSGVITVTEAAGVICLYALAVGLLVYRGLRWRELGSLLYAAGRTSAVVLFLLAAAGPFAWLLNEAHIATAISHGILGISTHHLVVLLVVNMLLLAVGMILEPLPALVMFVPTLLPIQVQLGIDPIQFAVIVIVNLMIGMLHPPVGLLIFVTSAVGRVPLWDVAREILPFLGWALVVLTLISIFPDLITFLPRSLT